MTNMDKRALKSTIIELKESGLSFQNISDILAKDYDIHMSRQAVCGMYNRATSDEVINKNKELILTTEDIVNYNSIGLSNCEIKEVLNKLGYSITLSDIEYILSINTEYKKSVEMELVQKIIRGLKLGNEIAEIRAKITYKGLSVTDNKLKSLLKISAEQMIYEQSKKVLASIYNATDDKALVKDIIAEHNMNITMKDIENTENGAMINGTLVLDNTQCNILRPKQIISKPETVKIAVNEEY